MADVFNALSYKSVISCYENCTEIWLFLHVQIATKVIFTSEQQPLI